MPGLTPSVYVNLPSLELSIFISPLIAYLFPLTYLCILIIVLLFPVF